MPLQGQRILLVEDNILVALDIEDLIFAHRGEVAARAATVKEALKRAETPGITIAILDARLGEDDALPVAERLREYGVPFLFYTGRTFEEISKAWPNTPIVLKPASDAALVKALASLIAPELRRGKEKRRL